LYYDAQNPSRARVKIITKDITAIQIFTPDKDQLRHAIIRSGERELALDLVSSRARRYDLRHDVMRFLRRGREFARRIAHIEMCSWTAAFIKPHVKPTYEIRNQQTNRNIRAGVLAA